MSIKINSLELENVKKIKAVRLTPTQNGLTVIGGRNGQGKTSVLDAIAWALGGDRFRPSAAKREDSVLPPRLHLVLSNGVVVDRKGKNSALTVTDPTGKRSGQQLLNDLISVLALDLPRFLHATDREKADTLLQIIGMKEQVDQLEQEETKLYNRRHSIGQIADQKKKYAKELPFYKDAPDEPVSPSELIAQQQAILAQNGENQRKRLHAAALKGQVEQLQAKVDTLTKQLADANAALFSVTRDYETAQKSAQELVDQSTAELEENLRQIEEINAMVRTNQDKRRAEREAKEYEDEYIQLTQQLTDTRWKKSDLLAHAPLPLPGLSVEQGALTYQGQKWDCLSGSDQLKVATAIVRRLNPECGFVLLDKLEQMDLDTLTRFGGWLEQEGLQVIATRVSTGEECTVVLEDGEVKDDKTPVPQWEGVSFGV